MSGGQTKAITILCLKRFLRVFNFPFLVFFPALQVPPGFRGVSGNGWGSGPSGPTGGEKATQIGAALALVAFDEATLIVSVC